MTHRPKHLNLPAIVVAAGLLLCGSVGALAFNSQHSAASRHVVHAPQPNLPKPGKAIDWTENSLTASFYAINTCKLLSPSDVNAAWTENGFAALDPNLTATLTGTYSLLNRCDYNSHSATFDGSVTNITDHGQYELEVECYGAGTSNVNGCFTRDLGFETDVNSFQNHDLTNFTGPTSLQYYNWLNPASYGTYQFKVVDSNGLSWIFNIQDNARTPHEVVQSLINKLIINLDGIIPTKDYTEGVSK